MHPIMESLWCISRSHSWTNDHPQHGYKVQLLTIAKVIVDILKQLNFQMNKYNIIHQLIETKFAHWPGTYPAIAQSKVRSMRKLHPKLIAWIYVFKVPTKWNREVWTSRNIKHSLQQILGEKKRISAWSIVEAKSSNARKGTGTVPVRRCFLGTSASIWASVPSQSEEPILACATLCGMPLSFSHGYWSKLGTPTLHTSWFTSLFPHLPGEGC